MLMHKVLGTPGKPWLIFFNSLGCDWGMWDAQVAVLEKDRQILLVNKPGHGDAPVGEPIDSIQGFADALIATMDSLGIEKAEYCGLSIGGRVGTVLGSDYAPRFRRLILVCGGTGDPTKASFWAQRIAMARDNGMAGIAEGSVSRWFDDAFTEKAPGDVAKIKGMVAACDPEGYAHACEALRDQDTLEQTRNISVPTMVVAGGNDQSTPVAALRAMSDMINGALYIEIDAGHIVNVERPAEFNRALVGFLGP